MKKEIKLGKIDYEGKGVCNLVTIEIEYKMEKEGPALSICGNIWDRNKSDIVAGGQIMEDLVEYFNTNLVFKKIYRLWKLYHLNDMHPECTCQRKAGWKEVATQQVSVSKLGKTEEKPLGWLTEEEHPKGILSKKCPACGYRYGSKWNYMAIPEIDEKIIKQLLSK